MNSLEIRNRKIIDAVIRKEQAVCPGAIALIGIYGSFQTGDIHPLSDLDLLILINDDRGWQLGKAFIQEDLGVGHDIYCTTRESLRQDAEYDHPHISKLMDAQIVRMKSTGLSWRPCGSRFGRNWRNRSGKRITERRRRN